MEASQTNLLLSAVILVLVLLLTKNKKKEGFWPNESSGVGATGVAPYISGVKGSVSPLYYGG